MNRHCFIGRCFLVALLLALSPSLLAQSDFEVTISGMIYYSGRHTGPIHIVPLDLNDQSDPVDVNNVAFAAHTMISEPGAYSLTIPHAPVGHSYVVLAQMDIDDSGAFSLESFKTYEPSGDHDGCNLGGCNASGPLSVDDLLAAPEVDIYLTDSEPSCVLLSTFEADFLSGHADGYTSTAFHKFHDYAAFLCAAKGLPV